MPAITKRFVDTAEPGRHYDDKLAGFGLYVGKSSRSYFLEYRPGRGRKVAKRRISIGKHGAPWTPTLARDRALELLAAVKAGRDPLEERGAPSARTVANVIEEWLKRDQAKNRSAKRVAQTMQHDVLPVWGHRPIEEIRKRDVIELIDSVADRGAPIMANKVLSHVKRLLKWAASRDIIESDPAAHVEKVAPQTKRDRVLSDIELAAVWQAADEVGYPFGPAVQMLILTAARRQEIFDLPWSEIDGASIRLSSERSKVKEERVIPLSPPAQALLEALPRVGEQFVFTYKGTVPFNIAGRAKANLDKVIAANRGAHLPYWRLHDIRRTVATGMQRLGVRLEVIETVLGHVSGSRAGVVGIYQRHRFEDEAKAALTAWGEYVARLSV